MEQNDTKIKISVRNLVEFILRSGDLDNRQGSRRDSVDAMQQIVKAWMGRILCY